MYYKVLNITMNLVFNTEVIKMGARPTVQDARVLAGEMNKPCLIPLTITRGGIENPAEIYLNMREKYDSSYLLESIGGSRGNSRYSIIGCRSLIHVEIRDGQVEIDGAPGVVEASEGWMKKFGEGRDELEVLRKIMLFDEMRFLGLNLPRYVLGATGYVGYDFIRSAISLGSNCENDLHHPVLEFMLPGLVIVLDHHAEQTHYASILLLTEDTDFKEAYQGSMKELRNLRETKSKPKRKGRRRISATSNVDKEDFEGNVERIKEYIRAGDVIQTVLSRRIDLDPSPQLGEFYTRLRKINPSPYMFFLDFPDRSLVGSSPEALVRVQGKRVLTRPIAGTRRRGKNKVDDLEMERDLMEDEKERAEHVMLVDLGRNDIGRVSKFGSVKIPEFMEVEKYGDVQHMVSTVTGKLREGKDAFDALRAVFPAGTVTGAPKVRAMEIIEELEPTRRGIYSGAVGTFSYAGAADFAITIRSLTEEDGRAQVQVGAGIVSDSVPWKEYYETENKAKSLLRSAGVKNESSRNR